MKPSLQLRLSQHLALTPQLQQSIRLLQLSTLELQQEVEQMLEQNPFLENDEEQAATFELPQERASTERVNNDESEGSDNAGGDGEITGAEFGTTANEEWENGTERDDFDGIRETPGKGSGADGDEGGGDGENQRVASMSLQEHLRSQVVGMRLSDEDALALQVLIDSLNVDGYLADTLEDIAERLHEMLPKEQRGESQEILERLQCGLRWLQSFDPPGVGARNLPECLVIQLLAKPKSPTRQLAIRISQKYLELLARRDMKRLMALTGADEDALRLAQAMIVSCEPKPARPFADAESNIIVPDVIVSRSGRGLKVALNPDVMPKLRIVDLYAQAIRGQRNGSGAGLSSRLQEARWFVKNIQQRFDTILRVSKAIVERQKNFFTHGDIAMKPLVLREIADELGLHESTISRVTTAKYMATPGGTYELKYFFGSSLHTEAGGAASSTAVRALIRQFVVSESTKKPLSDNQISEMLKEQGIECARRTVAKYREALRIAPANLRKAL